jgi:hypothetical protein
MNFLELLNKRIEIQESRHTGSSQTNYMFRITYFEPSEVCGSVDITYAYYGTTNLFYICLLQRCSSVTFLLCSCIY